MDWLLRTEFWAMFRTLTGLEIVLGIDNVIFHSLTIAKLPLKLQKKARIAGMSLAILMRFALLAGIIWFMGVSKALLVVLGQEISARDIVLIGGGLFLVIKSCLELSHNAGFDGRTGRALRKKAKDVQPNRAGIISCVIEIVILDIVFSLDSVITAVGMVNDMRAIMLAVVVSVIVMMFCTDSIGRFLQTHKRVRTLAFCFIALVGAVLLVEGFDMVVPKNQIYVAGGFALLIEYALSRYRAGKKSKPVTASVIFSKPKPQFSVSVAAIPTSGQVFSQITSRVSCNCENSLSYGFCVDCGDGLGSVTLDLGKVDYRCLLNN
jgi:predicted tellurium resistance membrane protein TerC